MFGKRYKTNIWLDEKNDNCVVSKFDATEYRNTLPSNLNDRKKMDEWIVQKMTPYKHNVCCDVELKKLDVNKGDKDKFKITYNADGSLSSLKICACPRNDEKCIEEKCSGFNDYIGPYVACKASKAPPDISNVVDGVLTINDFYPDCSSQLKMCNNQIDILSDYAVWKKDEDTKRDKLNEIRMKYNTIQENNGDTIIISPSDPDREKKIQEEYNKWLLEFESTQKAGNDSIVQETEDSNIVDSTVQEDVTNAEEETKNSNIGDTKIEKESVPDNSLIIYVSSSIAIVVALIIFFIILMKSK